MDNDTLNDVIAAESFSVECQLSIGETVNPTCDESRAENNLTTSRREHHWNNLLINTASISELHLPERGVYELKRIWERPAGHAIKGIDAFKLRCHVNSLNEPAMTVIGDSGAAPMLISQEFLKSLTASKPKM